MLDRMTVVMHCSVCGIESSVACTCGAPYVAAGERAAKAIAENPEKSDRAIAADIGVSHTTIQNVRKSTGNQLPVETKRVGRDGRTRRMPRGGGGQRQDDNLKCEIARKAMRATIQAGKSVDREHWAKKLDISVGTVQRAGLMEQAYFEGLQDGRKGRDENSETMVSIHVLIEEFVPLFELVKEQSKRHIGLISTGALQIAASKGRRLLDQWASGDKTVRRVRGHVVPDKNSANTMKGAPDGCSL